MTGTYDLASLPPFVSSTLGMATGNLAITFFRRNGRDACNANVVPSKIHVRESGSYTGGVTLTASELLNSLPTAP